MSDLLTAVAALAHSQLLQFLFLVAVLTGMGYAILVARPQRQRELARRTELARRLNTSRRKW